MKATEASRLHFKSEPRLVSGQLYSMLDMIGPVITCDKCGAWQRVSALTVAEAADAALALGWAKDGQEDICPGCNGGKL